MSKGREVEAFGMKWRYSPNRCYVGLYRGYEIVLRRIPTHNGMHWRLAVHPAGSSGIGLAFEHQFYKNSVDGRAAGIEMVDESAKARLHTR